MAVTSWCLLVIWSLGWHGAVAQTCQTDHDCQAHCTAEDGSCVAVCDSFLKRCACEQSEALRKDGGCSDTPRPDADCFKTYQVNFAVIVPESTELTVRDVETDRPSAAFITVVRRCVAAAIERSRDEVVPQSTTFVPNGLNGTALFQGFVTALVTFEFCLPHPALELLELGASAGQAFSREADNFAMVGLGSFVVSDWAETRLTTTVSQTAAEEALHEAPAEEGDSRLVALSVAFAAMALVFCTISLFCYCARCKEHSAMQALTSSFLRGQRASPPGEPPSASAEEGMYPIVRAARSFNVHELGEESNPMQDGMGRCLSIREGEVLEVLVNTGEWLYGRSRERGELGFFPENRIMWLGRPVGGAVTAPVTVLPEPAVLGRAGTESEENELRAAANTQDDVILLPGTASQGAESDQGRDELPDVTSGHIASAD